MSTVLDNPSARDVFQLDPLGRSPGLTVITSGGDAKETIEDQQQPLAAGANTVVRKSENTTIVYELTCWLPGHLETIARWKASLLAGRNRTKPAVYTLTDARLAESPIRVIYENIGPEEVVKPGGPWKYKLTVHRYSRVKPHGGPIVPGFLDPELKAAQATNKGLQLQLDALKKGPK